MTKKPEVNVPKLKIKLMQITLRGERLVVNNFDEKSREGIRGTGPSVTPKKRQPRQPLERFVAASYPWPDTPLPVVTDESTEDVIAASMVGRFGFPSIGVKATAVRAAPDVDMKMTAIKRAFHIDGDLVEIHSDEVRLREDIVRLDTVKRPPDLRYRPEFLNWHMNVEIRFNSGVIQPDEIFNLYQVAGYGVGLGEWRPEKGGQWGTFTIDPKITVVPIEDVKPIIKEAA